MRLVENDLYLYLANVDDTVYTLVSFTGKLEIPEELRLLNTDDIPLYIFEDPFSNSPFLTAIVLEEDLCHQIFPLTPFDMVLLYGKW